MPEWWTWFDTLIWTVAALVYLAMLMLWAFKGPKK